MKALTTILLSVLLVLSAVLVAADSVPLNVVKAEIDDTKIEPFGVNNKLNIERDQDFELKLELFAVNDVKDIEIRAFISGYEFNDIKSISDRIGPFDFYENVTYVKKMTLSLPDDVDTDDYQLRLVISDRFNEQVTYNYALQVDSQRHDVKIEDITLSSSSVKAGQAVLASVRLENLGQKTEDDVKVVVSIPSFNLSGTDYIEEIKVDKQEETEEVFLKLPKCAAPGVYDVNVEAVYNDGHDKVSDSAKVTVVEDETCNPAPIVVVQQNQTQPPVADSTGKVRNALEIILLVLVALLVIVGLIIGFTRMRGED